MDRIEVASRALLIIAAGKSSRFGGYPKAFANVGSGMNVNNTIKYANKFYKKIFVGVNASTFQQFHDKIHAAKIFSIVTGQGDAHSLLKCLNYIRKNDSSIERIDICWGDAFFKTDAPFGEFYKEVGSKKIYVACSWDENPYAWFDVNDKKEVLMSHFASNEDAPCSGLHDQSLFSVPLNEGIILLNKYRIEKQIPEENDERKCDVNEMKLLDFFTYLAKNESEMVKCIEISSGNISSFNTEQELLKIITKR